MVTTLTGLGGDELEVEGLFEGYFEGHASEEEAEATAE